MKKIRKFLMQNSAFMIDASLMKDVTGGSQNNNLVPCRCACENATGMWTTMCDIPLSTIRIYTADKCGGNHYANCVHA